MMSSTCAAKEALCCGCCATWWAMTAMQSALAEYHSGADKDPSYLQKLLQTSSQARPGVVLRRLGLSRSRAAGLSRRVGLYPAAAEREAKSFLVTVTIENRGRAGAEVPVHDADADRARKVMRVLVKAGREGNWAESKCRSRRTRSWSTMAACRRPMLRAIMCYDVPPPAKEYEVAVKRYSPR